MPKLPQKPTNPPETAKTEVVESPYQAEASANFYNSSDNSYVRSPGGREIYEKFRPDETIPECKTQRDQQQIMLMSDDFYHRNGMVRSVIDMMAEIGVAGIRINHTDVATQEFYDAWSKRVKLKDRAEHFLRWYFRSGNVVLQRRYGSLKRGKVPVRYFFYNPGTIDLIGDFYGTVSDTPRYGIRIPTLQPSSRKTPTTDIEKQVYNGYPPEVKKALENRVESGSPNYIPLPADDIYVAYYKKDDTSIWAVPFMYSIFEDLLYNKKLKLTKTSMLDGMACPILLWKLGNTEKQLLPSPAMGQKLLSIVQGNGNGGPINLVWDDAISLDAHYPPIEQIVNFEEKIDSILWGLGIQMYKSGTSTGSQPVGLKDLISRIKNGRDALIAWLDTEFEIIRKSMGFRRAPQASFDYSDLYDDKVYWTLMKDLIDRNIISDDRIREIIHENSEVERYRIDRDEDLRKKGDIPQKASPFHNPLLEMQQKHELKKIQSENLVKEKNSGKPAGRPVGSRDKMPRVVRANIVTATRIFDNVDRFVQNLLMEDFGVTDARQLTADQKKQIQEQKVAFYPMVSPEKAELEGDALAACISSVPLVSGLFHELFQEYTQGAGINKLTNEEIKIAMIHCYCEAWNHLDA